LAFLSKALSSTALNSTLIVALFLIDLALIIYENEKELICYRVPNRSVETVSASLYEDGEQLIMRVVLELPPNDS
jgi:hypothetical protein